MDSILGSAGNWLLSRRAQQGANSIGREFDEMAEGASSTVSRFWDGLVGKTQAPLTELLEKFELPKGLFPKNISSYSFTKVNDDGGMLSVKLPFPCEVKFPDGSLIRYDRLVSCSIMRGVLANIEGMKTQWVVWLSIIDIARGDLPGDGKALRNSGSSKIYFTTKMRRAKDVAVYESLREAVEVFRY